jgi:hypothetical protein
MTHQEQVAREEQIAREDLLLGAEVIARINSSRRRLRNSEQPLAASEIQDIYQVLGECALELSAIAHERQQNEARRMIIARMLDQMSFAAAPEPCAVSEMPDLLPVFAETAQVAAD